VSGSPETIHERGREALLAGREVLDVPPAPGGTRWGLSVVVRPDDDAAGRLAELAAEAAAFAGPGQWLTGSRDISHLTVTYLERVHREVGDDDPPVRRYAELVGRLAAATPPLRWRLVGVALADRGVLALADPVDPAPDELRQAVVGELGDLGRAEAYYRRSVWWSTLLHFAAPVTDRAGLAGWADERATRSFGSLTARAVEVVRYAFDGQRTVTVPMASFPLAGVRPGGSDGAHA
jgi:hypothetical protein